MADLLDAISKLLRPNVFLGKRQLTHLQLFHPIGPILSVYCKHFFATHLILHISFKKVHIFFYKPCSKHLISHLLLHMFYYILHTFIYILYTWYIHFIYIFYTSYIYIWTVLYAFYIILHTSYYIHHIYILYSIPIIYTV